MLVSDGSFPLLVGGHDDGAPAEEKQRARPEQSRTSRTFSGARPALDATHSRPRRVVVSVTILDESEGYELKRNEAKQRRGPTRSRAPRVQAFGATSEAGKKYAISTLRVLERVGAVRRVLADVRAELFPNGSGSRLRRVGRAHEVALGGDGVLSFEHGDDDGRTRHELNELAEERTRPVHVVESLGDGAGEVASFRRHDREAPFFELSRIAPALRFSTASGLTMQRVRSTGMKSSAVKGECGRL